MRTQKTIRNIIFSFINTGATTLLSFVSRIVFARVLSQEYLGVSGLFTSILTVLSLAELGIGDAIGYSLYEPLAKNDLKKVQGLMQLYGKIYRAIGGLVLLAGVLLLPVYPFMISGSSTVENLDLIYFLFILNTSVSYFGVYKKNLIVYDQRAYIANIYNLIFYGVRIIAQTVFLLITRNYIIYLVIQVIFTILENLVISARANLDYPFLKKKDKQIIPQEEIRTIKKNTFALMLHKMGDVLLNSMDNILLSKLYGLAITGIYSNYYMVFNSLGGIIWRIFSSATASIGNLNASDSKEKMYDTFKASLFVNSFFTGLVVCCAMTSMQSFIRLAFGEDYLLDMGTLIALVVAFYVNRMRSAITSFRDATGAFYYDRYVTLIQAVVNIVSSFIFAHFWGIAGVFVGTSFSIITTTFWVEPLVLYRHSFEQPLGDYFIRYAKYTLLIAAISILAVCLTQSIPNGLVGLCVRGVSSAIIFSGLYLAINHRSPEMKYFVGRISGVVKKAKRQIEK